MSRGKFTSGSLQLKVPHDAPQRPPSHANLAKFCGFILLMFFIMASYLLSGERKTLLEDLSESTLRDLARSIGTKVTFRARRVPAVSELLDFDPHMFSVIPPHFLPDVKNPCWYEELRGNVSADPYGSNLFSRLYNIQNAFERLSATFKKQLILHDGKLQRLRCLPYFYIVGQAKCGTTDLYERLRLHPDVHLTPPKEPHWWSRRRFGINRPGDPPITRFPLDHYLDLFDPVAQRIQHRLLGNSSSRSSIITGTFSDLCVYFHFHMRSGDPCARVFLHDISREAEPPSLSQDFIHAVQPDARLIAILRDPQTKTRQVK